MNCPKLTSNQIRPTRSPLMPGVKLLPALIALCLLPATIQAQTPTNTLLSTLLQDTRDSDYPLGLSWRVPGEIPAQQILRLQLLNQLARPAMPAPSRSQLAAWLAVQPITGRVPVALADVRWLQANPRHDPHILPGHSVVMPQRPQSVTVLTPMGEPCQVRHQTGRHALDYLRACLGDNAGPIDTLWIAQPDGRTQRAGSGLWNETPQDEPAPGAWLWGPPRDEALPEDFSARLIEFLATQGPAAEAGIGTRMLYPATNPSPAPALPAGSASPAPDFSGRAEPVAPPATMQPAPEPARSRAPQSILPIPGDWGSFGLLQTPNARMAPASEVRYTVSRVSPYTRNNIFLQPFDWMEAGFRYTSISNLPYGPADLSGDQSYKDKSLDAKFRLMQESPWAPALALGFRDITGTGLFSGEYLVANKRFGLTDWSLGLAWGYGAGSGSIKNPLTVFNDRFATRKQDTGVGGNFSLSSYFAGNAALFGGVAIQLPDRPLVVKLEYDGNDYQREPRGTPQPQKTRFNLGVAYRLSRSVDVSAGIERGNTLMFALNFHTPLDQMTTFKAADASNRILAARPDGPPDWPAAMRDISRLTNWRISKIEQHDKAVRLTVDQPYSPYWRDRVDAATAVVHRTAPAGIEQITWAFEPYGMPTGEHRVDRESWVAGKTRPQPPGERSEPVTARDTRPGRDTPKPTLQSKRETLESGFGLGYQQSIGGPDGFVLYQLFATHQARLNLRDDSWMQSRIELGLLDNYDTFRYTGPSKLPRVRTYSREFATESDLRLSNLQATHVGRVLDNNFYSIYAGYLEAMYAGIGGEWLYRPFGSRIAYGVDINTVRQRDFAQHFRLRDYRVTTGHTTLYWDTGWQDVQLNLSAGQYLAGDVGVTVNLSRGFENGVRMGAFFTKTNVSAVQFGEGSFDKGVYVSIPFDAFLTRRSDTFANFFWQPLTRDGGAKLSRSVALYDLSNARDPRALRYSPATPPKQDIPPAEHPIGERAPEVPPPTALQPRPTVARDDTDAFERKLASALAYQGFSNVRSEWSSPHRLDLTLTSERIQPLPRAAHRAALVALRHAPLDTRSINIVFEERGQPATRYEFFDLERLDDFYSGLLDEQGISPYIAVRNLNPNFLEPAPLARFNDERRPEDEPTAASAVLHDLRPLSRVIRDIGNAGRLARDTDWTRPLLIGGGVILASRLLDHRADRFARDHQSSFVSALKRTGNALPIIATGAAALHALTAQDARSERTSYAAVESAGTALFAGTAMKMLFNRDRPNAPTHGKLSKDARQSFPSNHTAVAWAAITPYAIEHRAPWLYAAPLLTNAARVMDRKHWVSDTVAGGLIGYTIGVLFYQSGKREALAPRVYVQSDEIGLSWPF